MLIQIPPRILAVKIKVAEFVHFVISVFTAYARIDCAQIPVFVNNCDAFFLRKIKTFSVQRITCRQSAVLRFRRYIASNRAQIFGVISDLGTVFVVVYERAFFYIGFGHKNIIRRARHLRNAVGSARNKPRIRNLITLARYKYNGKANDHRQNRRSDHNDYSVSL